MTNVFFVVNGREMKFVNDNSIYRLPTLHKTTKTGKDIRWEIYVQNNNEIITESYYHPDGKRKISDPTFAKGKNKGKANETTNFQQAIFTVYSKWLKKKDQKYVELGKIFSYNVAKNFVRPMLAQKYTDRGKKYLTEPFGVSPKLDGIRALAYLDKYHVILESRNGKQFNFIDTVRRHILELLRKYGKHIILDGELYSHDLTFNQISGITRAARHKSPYDDKMEYYIFDNMDKRDYPYSRRMEIQDQLMEIYHSMYPNPEDRVLKFVGYQLVNHSDIHAIHDLAVRNGYEGIMMRELSGKYEIGQRSNYLLKYKEFKDEEFKIVGYTTGEGGESGAIIFICVTPEGEEFSVRPRGTVEHRREMYRKGNYYINKELTVRFQEKDPVSKVPRFPVGIGVRDYE